MDMLAGAPGQSALGQAHLSPVVLAHEMPFSIGDAEIRPSTREVLFDGQSSIVEPRVMQLIVALHRARGEVVAKDDLADLCWEGRIVGEDAINRVVSRARAVADKQAGRQFRIETITKVGYRLLPATIDVAADNFAPASDSHLRIGRRELLIGAGVVAAAGAAGTAFILYRRDTTPPEARMLIDSARKSLREGDLDSAGNAIGTLRQAAEMAPDIAEAWGLLALAYTMAAIDSTAAERPNLRARASAAIKRALALEPDQADALAAQVRMTPMYRNWYAYEQACREALRNHPDHPELMVVLAGLLLEVGRIREALQLYQQTLPAMPLSTDVLTSHADCLWSLGMLDEADAAIDAAFNLLPRNYGVWNTKACYLMFNGRAREALAMYLNADARPLGVEETDMRLTIQQSEALIASDPKLIREAIDAIVATAESGKGYLLGGAVFTAFVGDVDQSFRLLNAFFFDRGFKVPDQYFNRAYTSFGGERHTVTLFARSIAADRSDPRFAAMTREIGLDGYWDRTNSRSLVVA